MKKILLSAAIVVAAISSSARINDAHAGTAAEPSRSSTTKSVMLPVDWVNPFIGTTNFGATNPGAVTPNGLMSVAPFNVMGSDLNKYDKDARWWSTPYEFENSYFTGFSHVNLSGVGCPDAGSLLLMPTAGALEVDYKNYGSTYSDQQATPGYYGVTLDKYHIRAEATATTRCAVTRFTFPAGEAHILLNLGQGLTNESGATLRKVSDTEIEGSKLLGTFCYNPKAVFPIYFVMRISKAPAQSGCWKKQRPMTGVKAEWDPDQGKYKIYAGYSREMSGDDVGYWFTFDAAQGEQVEVRMGVSFTSIENARRNLDAEARSNGAPLFDRTREAARNRWNEDLSRIMVEGGTDEQKTVFYTALYHTLIHPNILQDVNGDYPAMESLRTMNTGGEDRYTVFSLWDTYRNLHQLMTLVYPERQVQMVRSMLDMYRENGWLPKWELFSRETLTMEGDPAIPVIADTWFKGLRGFDINLAYQAMYKSATTPGARNPMRPDIDDYIAKGYVPLGTYSADLSGDNSVSHALEYYIADHALSQLAAALGKKDDAAIFMKRSEGWRNYYNPEYGTFCPRLSDGKFLTPFDPKQGADFEAVPGFHEGSAWNYTFYVPHDVKGLAKVMGGTNKFVDKLQMVFDKGYYDPANEPDIAYPYLFSYFPGQEWRTQKEVTRLLSEYYTTKPNGIPGNDDCGTMSAWAVFSMMGFYPDCPGEPYYTLTSPVFDRITIKLDPQYYPAGELVVETKRTLPGDIYVKRIVEAATGKALPVRIDHTTLISARTLHFELGSR